MKRRVPTGTLRLFTTRASRPVPPEMGVETADLEALVVGSYVFAYEYPVPARGGRKPVIGDKGFWGRRVRSPAPARGYSRPTGRAQPRTSAASTPSPRRSGMGQVPQRGVVAWFLDAQGEAPEDRQSRSRTRVLCVLRGARMLRDRSAHGGLVSRSGRATGPKGAAATDLGSRAGKRFAGRRPLQHARTIPLRRHQHSRGDRPQQAPADPSAQPEWQSRDDAARPPTGFELSPHGFGDLRRDRRVREPRPFG